MKRLVLIRHAHAAHDGTKDFVRDLTSEGFREAGRAGIALRDAGVLPDLVLASPARRTAATATGIVAQLDPCNQEIVFETNLYYGGLEEALEVIRMVPNEVNTLYIIGHNPTIAELIYQFQDTGFFPVPPATVVVVELPATTWQEATLTTGTAVKLFP